MSGARRRSQVAERPRRWRVDLSLVLAGVLVIVVVAALGLTRPEAARLVETAPRSAPLTSAHLICPGSGGGAGGSTSAPGEILVGSGAGEAVTGAATVSDLPDSDRAASAPATVALQDGRISARPAGRSPQVLHAAGEVASAFFASLASTSDSALTAAECAPPSGDQWFTGVGAGPTQASVVELANPNPGLAIADITVLSDEGPLQVDALRGIAVEPGRSTRIDLGEVIPRTGVMALHVSVVRGQLGVAVRDRGERLTGGTSTEDWLPAQAAPSTTNVLLGLQPGSGRHTLVLANDSDRDVSADLRLITSRSVFAPEGAGAIEIPARSAVATVLDPIVKASSAADAFGLEVSASGPLTASVRSVVSGDLSFLVPGTSVSAEAWTALPSASATVQLAAASAVGVATVVARSAQGAEVLRERVGLAPGAGAELGLPRTAASVEVTTERGSTQGAVLLTRKGAGSAVLRLRETVRAGQIPAVIFGP